MAVYALLQASEVWGEMRSKFKFGNMLILRNDSKTNEIVFAGQAVITESL